MYNLYVDIEIIADNKNMAIHMSGEALDRDLSPDSGAQKIETRLPEVESMASIPSEVHSAQLGTTSDISGLYKEISKAGSSILRMGACPHSELITGSGNRVRGAARETPTVPAKPIPNPEPTPPHEDVEPCGLGLRLAQNRQEIEEWKWGIGVESGSAEPPSLSTQQLVKGPNMPAVTSSIPLSQDPLLMALQGYVEVGNSKTPGTIPCPAPTCTNPIPAIQIAADFENPEETIKTYSLEIDPDTEC